MTKMTAKRPTVNPVRFRAGALVWILLMASRGAAQTQSPNVAATELVRRTVAHELAANDRGSQYMYRVHKETSQSSETYVTVETRDEGLAIARALVTERLAACVNILGPATSVYTWEGKMEDAQEFVMVCKTRRTLAQPLSARVKALHSYDTPCIVTYAIESGFPPFLDWIAASTRTA